jgi:penicillin-binding protein 2
VDVVAGQGKRVASDALPPIAMRPEHVEVIKRALQGVTQEGTSTRVFAGAAYASGGKTGTAQAVGVKQNEKYNASKMEEHQRDHSLYIAMAPVEAPTLALAVVVENAGFGSDAAAPIARRVFDYLLLGQYPSVEDMAATRIGKSWAPIGKPRQASEIPLPAAPGLAASAVALTPAARLRAAAGAGADPATASLAQALQPPPAVRMAPSPVLPVDTVAR